MKMLDAHVFKDDINLCLAGTTPRGHFVTIVTPDGCVEIRGRTGKQAVANALRWAAARNVELHIRVVTK